MSGTSERLVNLASMEVDAEIVGKDVIRKNGRPLEEDYFLTGKHFSLGCVIFEGTGTGKPETRVRVHHLEGQLGIPYDLVEVNRTDLGNGLIRIMTPGHYPRLGRTGTGDNGGFTEILLSRPIKGRSERPYKMERPLGYQ